ncbi:hypothetical protein PSAC2689_50258 [Paraburkholderia sacchari]
MLVGRTVTVQYLVARMQEAVHVLREHLQRWNSTISVDFHQAALTLPAVRY